MFFWEGPAVCALRINGTRYTAVNSCMACVDVNVFSWRDGACRSVVTGGKGGVIINGSAGQIIKSPILNPITSKGTISIGQVGQVGKF